MTSYVTRFNGILSRITSSSFVESLKRRKKLERDAITDTKLNRCLTTFDLTTLGIGSTLGLGIYVLSGEVAATKAGPAIVISFFVAAVASLFAGLCYAEFGARVPKAGSAYIYSYITVGEFMAFVIGWNLVLEYLIGTASVARGYSVYIDSLVMETGWSFESFFRYWMPIDVNHLSSHPDFLAFFLTMFLTLMLTLGVKESTRFNSIFTCVNILVVLYVVSCGIFKADLHNWNLSQDEVPHRSINSNTNKDGGAGGFFPFGVSGMMAGAATCFFAFIGFDVIATTGEEAKNPQKSIPIAISLSLFLVFLAYFSVSGIQTLMWPYWDQNTAAPLPYVFHKVGWPFAKWVVSIGALAGLSTSLLGAMFPLPRILYSMATDGVIFRQLADIHPRFQTPLLATFVSGFLAACLSAIFDIQQLADMMSIGTLLAYSLVAISVVILRYSNKVIYADDIAGGIMSPKDGIEVVYSVEVSTFSNGSPNHDNSVNKSVTPAVLLLNLNNEMAPTEDTSRMSLILITIICSLIVTFNLLMVTLEDYLFEMNNVAVIIIFFVGLLVILSIMLLTRQPQSSAKLSFQVPFVPIIPFLSVGINVYLMMKLSTATWVRFAIWMIIGFAIYFGYGISHSTGYLSSEEKKLQDRLLKRNDEVKMT